MAKPIEHASAKTLADLTGIDAKTVSRILAHAGIDARRGAGYPKARALKAIEAGLDTPLASGHALSGRGNLPASGLSQLAEAKSRGEIARASKLEFDLEIKRGAYILKADAEAATRDIIVRARTHLLQLPSRIAPDLVDTADPLSIAATLDKEIRRTLETLSEHDRSLLE